jgi:threonine/homoserine/homoserine lactone efflux protein
VIGDLAIALGLGVGLGAITGLPLGVVNVAIVEAAGRGDDRGRSAAGIGVGGALADMVHAALAFGGVGRVIVARPAAAAVLHVIAGVILIAYAASVWRARTAGEAASDARRTRAVPASFGRGVLTGVGLTLPNPAALGAWIAVAAAMAPASTALGLVTAAGVGVGSAAWFVTLARLAARGVSSPVAPRRGLTRAVAIAIAVLGVAAIVRGVR